MPRRVFQSTADYMVIALTPALVMTLVGSLVFFLLAVFYQGSFPARLHWQMACFVFAAVLIARISIESGFERAMPFGIALALAVGVAVNNFMEVQGTAIDSFSWAINWGMIALIWWCAHQLTWDCTVIDDSQDASGEGLLEIAGLERPAAVSDARAADQRIEGTTSRDVPAGWWQRYVEHQRRPHAPGVWVVYFSLAALPLFGIGQSFIPASNLAVRRYVFWLLAVYVASGMALLLTTSFLGLRRYLRQRRIEMPTTMASLWLSTGAVLIVVLLVFAMLLPRPSAEYAISQLPFTVGSPEQRASRVAPVPREGTEGEQPGSAPDNRPAEEQDQDQSGGGSKERPGGKPDGGELQGSKPSDKGQPDQSGEQSDKSDQSGEASQRRDQDSRDAKSKQSQQGRQAKSRSDSAKSRDEEPSRQEEPSPDRQAQEQDSSPSGKQSDGMQTPDIEAPAEALMTAASQLGLIVQWIFYGVVAVGVLYGLWRSRATVLAGIREFFRTLAELWAALWGGGRRHAVRAEDAVAIEIPPTPFSSFADPFATGIAERYSLEELVRYSFEAFEAWAREHGCPRQPDQTPHELARDVSRINAPIAADARNLAELYARAAYDRGELPASSPEQLEHLWRSMRAAAPAVL